MVKKIVALIIIAVMTISFAGCTVEKKPVFDVTSEQILQRAKKAGFEQAWVDEKSKHLYFFKSEDNLYFSSVASANELGSFSIKNVELYKNEELVKALYAIMPLYDAEFSYKEAEKIVSQIIEQEGHVSYNIVTVRYFQYEYTQDEHEKEIFLTYSTKT